MTACYYSIYCDLIHNRDASTQNNCLRVSENSADGTTCLEEGKSDRRVKKMTSFMFCTTQQILGCLYQIDKRVGECNVEYKYTNSWLEYTT
jgi:hypothetical protein